MNASLGLSREKLSDFCRRWQVSELAVFGSILRDDFRPDSDIDMLVAFLPGTAWSLLDHARMQQELAAMFGRPVDLITRRAVERSHNPIRRRAILSTAEPIYVAR